MTLATRLRQTASRYRTAVEQVLTEWVPECGCQRPGAQPACEACPGLALFEQRVREAIIQLHSANGSINPLTSPQPHHDSCIPAVSKSQV